MIKDTEDLIEQLRSAREQRRQTLKYLHYKYDVKPNRRKFLRAADPVLSSLTTVINELENIETTTQLTINALELDQAISGVKQHD